MSTEAAIANVPRADLADPGRLARASTAKRVALVVPSLGGGGAERVMITLARHVDRERFRTVLVVLNAANGTTRHPVPPGVDLVELGGRRVRDGLPRLVGWLRRERPDVVVSTLTHLNVGLGLARPLLPAGMRVIARESILPRAYLDSRPLAAGWRVAYRVAYRRFDGIVCQSEDMRREMVDMFDVPPSRTTVITNPVDVDLIRDMIRDVPGPREDGTIDLLSVGRLDVQKGHDLALEAIARAEDGRIRLHIAGEGSERARLESRVRALGLEARVTLGGFASNPYALMRRAHGLLVCSRFEGFPNAVVEALACGTPIIAAPFPGGLAEIVRSAPGWVHVASDRSVDAVAAVIRRFAGSPSDRVPSGIADRWLSDPIDAYEAALAR